MTEEQKRQLVELTTEQRRKLEAFLNAYDELFESGVMIVENDWSYYAFSISNLDEWRLSDVCLDQKEMADGWVDDIPFFDVCPLPRLAADMCLDDVLQGRVRCFKRDKNMFNG